MSAVDPAAVQRLLDQREAQGLPRHVTDKAVLAKVAAIIRRARQEAEGTA